MAYEILKSIVEAEARAEEIKRQAREDVKAMMKAAEEEKETLFAKVRMEAKSLSETAVKDAAEESDVAIQSLKRETEDSCAKLREQSAKKKEEAIQAVFGKVVGRYGSC